MKRFLPGALVLIAFGGEAQASSTGVALSSAFRLPLFDGADPLPWTGAGRAPVGGMRLDFLTGFMLHTPVGWEGGFHGRLSGYAMAWSEQNIQPGHRGALEWSVRRFVPPNDMRETDGFWSGGYAGASLMTEIWGRYAADPFQVSTLHVVVGYRGLAQDVQPAFLELGVGAWGDRAATAGGMGFVVRAGAEFFRPVRGFGTR